MTGRSRLSQAGLELIKSFEGFHASAVRLPDGRWCVGHGHVRTAREGVTITEADAETLLRHDLRAAEEAIANLVFAPLDQNQYDALVSLVSNISPARFRDSDILHALNSGDYLVAAAGFDAWRKARINGRMMVVDALVRRRATEKALFLDHPDGRPSAPTPMAQPEFDGSSGETLPRMSVIEALTPERGEPFDDDDATAGQENQRRLPDIAEAIRHIAEQVGGAAQAIAPADSRQAAPVVQQETVAEPSETLEDARRAMADRVAKILERAEKAVAQAEAVVDREASRPAQSSIEARLRAILEAKPPAQAARPSAGRDIPEDLPDFESDAGMGSNGSRKLIDDTETWRPDREPAELFEEGVRNEKLVNGASRRFGPITGRAMMAAPWIVILVLSALGLGIGLVESFRGAATETAGDALQAAPVILAAFGILLVMSAYFIVTRQLSRK